MKGEEVNKSYSILHWKKIFGISRKQYKIKRRNNDTADICERIIKGIYLNIYIETIELFNFLHDLFLVIDSVKQDDLFWNALQETTEYIRINNCAGFIIHHKNINTSSILIDVYERKDVNFHFQVVSIETNNLENSFESAYPMQFTDEDFPCPYARESLSLLFGIFLYRNTFPDKFVNEAPEEIIFDNFMNNKKRHFILKSDESLIDRSGITPHFRRGHFRVLRSEVFKKKRFQTVFVHSSFVKGRAKTVLDNSEKEILIGAYS